ncbi:MAG TPA: AAA family ATPase, partial [Acidimicrobiia bacterium]|nr:AAA family ATPase [Acidimicrobiia bacterium]
MTTGLPEGPLTILFTDVEGSTDLRTRRGDVAAQALLQDHEDLVRSCVAQHGGREVKGLGDGLMVAFASVRRALTCATAIQQAVEEHGRKSPGGGVRVRIGINTGEVVDDGRDLYGQAVNAAARIAARAGAGEILISEVTRQLAGSGPDFDFFDRGRVRLKGFPDRWHLYGLGWKVGEPSGTTGPAPATTFVGREAELELLGRLLDRTRAGTTQVMAIEGEAGMGKSRLLDELVGLPAAAGFTLQRARAEELQPRPFGLVADALAIDIRSSDSERRLVAELLEADADGAAAEETDRRYRVIEGVINLVERAAIEGPVLAVYDDVHWADPSSIQALHVLCRRLAYLPVLVVIACRPLPRPPELGRLLDGLVDAGGRHLVLEPLPEEAVTSLAASRLDARPGPVLRARLAGAAGNPLFVLELLGALSEEGTIRVDADVAEATSTGESAPSLRLTILRRLAFLSPEGLELLRKASLFGGSFSAAQLSLVTDKPLLDVLASLEEAVTSGFVTAAGGTFAFRHDLVREALYLELPAAVRKGLHLHIGRTLAAAGAPPAEVANHLALGAEFGDREAVAWLRRAARELRSRAPDMAVQLLERAAALLPSQDPEWGSLVRQEIRTLSVAGRVREAQARAECVAVHVDTPQDAFKLALIQVDLLMLQARPREVVALTAPLLALPSLPPEARAQLMVNTAIARAMLGEIESVLAALDDLQPFTEAHPVSLPSAYCSLLRGYIARAQGFLRAGLEGVEGGTAVSGAHRLVQLLLYLGAFQTGADRVDEASATLDRARTELERAGYMALMQEYHWYSAVMHFTAGRWDDALAEAGTSRQLTKETGASGV